MAETSGLINLVAIGCLFFGVCTWIGKRGFHPLLDLQNFFRGWRASWMTARKAFLAFQEEWRNQWDEQWRRAGL